MNFEGLKTRVDRAESLVDGRLEQTQSRFGALKISWREAWTPPRIVIAGLIAGFITGRSEPRHALQKLGKLGGPKSIQLVSSLASMLTSLQAAVAVATAEKAASTADDAADNAEESAETAQQQAQATGPAPTVGVAPGDSGVVGTASLPADDDTPRPDRRRAEPAFAEQPRPAEAATEMSESER